MMSPPRGPEVHVRTRRELEDAGYGRRAIERLVAEGTIIALGRGYYATGDTPAAVLRALRHGHRVTCVDALNLYGFWVPTSRGDHRAALRSARLYIAPGGDVVLHAPILRSWPDPHPVLPLPLALEHAVHCLDADGAAIVLESGLHLKLIDASAVQAATASLSQRRQASIFPLRGDAESGTETRVRRGLTRAGVRMRSQVWVEGIGRVDLLVGERLIIECDSVAHHAGVEDFHRDRLRDLTAHRLGYTVVRLTWEQVMLDWDHTLATLLAMIRAGVHRRPRRRG